MSVAATSLAETAADPAERPLTIEEIASPAAEWDAFVRARADGTFCHLAGWQRVLESTLGARAHYLAARDAAGVLVGVLPLARVRGPLGDYLISVPFLNYGGALGDEAVRSALVAHAVRLGAALGVGMIELRSRQREVSELRATDRRLTVELRLPASEEELWNGLRAKLRSQIRRPMKEGMETRRGLGEVRAFHSVFAANMRDLGTPVLSLRFFESLAREFPDEVDFITVHHEGRPVAAACGFHFNGEFEMTWASSLRSHNHLAPNMLLYWESMRGAIARGADRFNFGRCAPNSGTHRFKLQWGGHDVALGWSTWPAEKGDALPSADRPIFKLATAVWQRMPLAVANRVGPVVSRWLP